MTGSSVVLFASNLSCATALGWQARTVWTQKVPDNTRESMREPRSPGDDAQRCSFPLIRQRAIPIPSESSAQPVTRRIFKGPLDAPTVSQCGTHVAVRPVASDRGVVMMSIAVLSGTVLRGMRYMLGPFTIGLKRIGLGCLLAALTWKCSCLHSRPRAIWRRQSEYLLEF